jgi:methionyl-tRNA synthetase
MDNVIPDATHSIEESINLKKFIKQTFASSAKNIEKVELRAALSSIINAAQETNKYLDKMEPWKTIKNNKSRTNETIFCALEAIYNIAIMLYPFIPFSSEKVLKTFGNENDYTEIKWEYSNIQPNLKLLESEILFEKLEIENINEFF